MLRFQPGNRGVVLPIALICCLLLGSMVFTFQFLSSSDYKQVGRLIRSLQASALADLASDEVFLALGTLSVGTADPKPAWVTALLDALDAARAAVGTGAPIQMLDAKQTIDFIDKVPVTIAAAAKTAGLVEVTGVKVVAGPFFTRAAAYSPKVFYSEAGFGDGSKDLFPWDLKAPFVVEVLAKGSKGPFEFSQRYLRSQDLNITDTTPPACEFALFSYMAPPTEDYALNDLQRGGRCTIVPGVKGRVHARGPLLLLPEEAPGDKLFMGTEPPVLDTPNYPQKSWTAWGSAPGPRVAQHPESQGAGPVAGMLARLLDLLEGVKSGMAPRRPYFEKSHTIFITKPVPILTFEIPGQRFDLGEVSVVLATGLETPTPVYQTNDHDEIAYFPPATYLYSPLAPGKQLWTVKPGSGSNDMFRGALVSAAAAVDQPPAPFVNGAGALAEGDLLACEPAPRNAGGACDIGLLGLYGTASVESKTYSTMTVRDVGAWAVKRKLDQLGAVACIAAEAILGTCDPGEIADKLLAIVGVDGRIGVLLRRFTVAATNNWTPPTGDLYLSTLEAALGNKEAVVVPYGWTWHEDGFWQSPAAPAALRTAMIDALHKPVLPWTTQQALDTIFKEGSLNTGWADAEAACPTGLPNVANDIRDWLCGDHAKQLMRATAGKDASAQFDAVKAVFDAGLRGGVRGVAPLAPERSKRPRGAFGDYAMPATTPSEELKAIERDFPGGFFPPKYRDWEAIATRSYPDMATYLAAETKSGVLELRGAVLIEKMDYPGTSGGSRDIPYRGRGIVIALTEDAAAPATLDAKLQPAAGAVNSGLVLAHRVSRALIDAGKYPPLRLGTEIKATVVSDTGVAPVGSASRIDGNLVTGLLNKRAIPASSGPNDGVKVVYEQTLGAAASGPRAPYWTLELGGEVSSLEPGS